MNKIIEKAVKGIEGVLCEFAQEVREETLREVEDSLRASVGGLPAKRKPGRPPKANGKAKPKTNGKASPARQLQGKYMGMLRRYKGREKAHIMALAKKQGVEAAIAEMEKMNGANVAPKAKATKKAAKAKAPKAAKPAKEADEGTDESEDDHLAKVLARSMQQGAAEKKGKLPKIGKPVPVPPVEPPANESDDADDNEGDDAGEGA